MAPTSLLASTGVSSASLWPSQRSSACAFPLDHAVRGSPQRPLPMQRRCFRAVAVRAAPAVAVRPEPAQEFWEQLEPCKMAEDKRIFLEEHRCVEVRG